MRFSSGAIAPYLAGNLGERNAHVPFWVGAGAVLLGVGVLALTRRHLTHIDDDEGAEVAQKSRDVEALEDEAVAISVGDA